MDSLAKKNKGLKTKSKNKRTEEKLKISEDEYRNLFENAITSVYARSLIEASLDPLVTISKEGKITDVNLATERITGVPREKLIGSDFADYFTQPDNARRGYKKVFSDGIVRDYPLTIRNTSGRETEVLYNATLFKNEDGEVQGVFAAARDIKAQKKLEKELQRSHKLLEKLNQHLLEVRENERSQIALNLHDDLGQKLTAINLDIAWLKCRIGVQSKPVREKLEDMSLMIKESVESIREISSFLRPAILFDLGLVTAINYQLKNFEKQTGIKCIFNCDPQDIVLDESISIVIFRILQESLTNIARHSGATETVVALKRTGTNIMVMIKDNGIGIAKDKINSISSLGIAGIKERIKSIDGKIIIGSEKGTGTRIKIVIPVKTETKND
jgi:PAS domain S-box-containing protein